MLLELALLALPALTPRERTFFAEAQPQVRCNARTNPISDRLSFFSGPRRRGAAFPALFGKLRKSQTLCKAEDQLVRKYWSKRPRDEIETELNRLGIEKDRQSTEELLEVLVLKVSEMTEKYSCRSSAPEEQAKARPAATFRWQDFVTRSSKVSVLPPTFSERLRESMAPDAPDRNFDDPVEFPPAPRTIGSGMTNEELRRRVMGGGESDVKEILEKGSRGDTGFSSQRDWVKEEEETTLDEEPGRFGRYADAAMPKTSISEMQDGWLKSFLLGNNLHIEEYTSQSEESEEEEEAVAEPEPQDHWGEKPGFVAMADLLCDESLDDDENRVPCIVQMMLGEAQTQQRSGNFVLDTSQDFGCPEANEKLHAGGRPLGDVAVSPSLLEGGITIDGILDASFLSKYDLDIDFGNKTVSFFEPGTVLRHNPSKGGEQVDLPLKRNGVGCETGAVTVKARIHQHLDNENWWETQEDIFQDVIAVVSTRHSKSVITPRCAAKFGACPIEAGTPSGTTGVYGGGNSGSSPSISFCDGIVGVVEFSSESSTLKTPDKKLDVVLGTDSTLKHLEEVAGGSPDIILGLDVLAGPTQSNRVTISWTHETIRISVPPTPEDD